MYYARPIFDQIQVFKTNFNSISFLHIYRERNGEVDGLSKVGLQLENGQMAYSRDQG
jgi:hypothetical protein